LLETASKASPSYGLIYQNLGTLYLTLALKAYQHAARVDHADHFSIRRAQQIQEIEK
jgi:hypothetical protein